MTANLHTQERDMLTSTFDDNEILPIPIARHRSAAALSSLMRDWESDGSADEDDSENDLMVLLSGMVCVSDTTPRDV